MRNVLCTKTYCYHATRTHQGGEAWGGAQMDIVGCWPHMLWAIGYNGVSERHGNEMRSNNTGMYRARCALGRC